ncbi:MULTISPECIES: glycoside hydrolase family 3 protein [unclassified Imperialibacter]|uniref:glycoside hydrolase family 3 protein n=1 Tax=unclassified Imperialibacter TaxID=2629706 RepID=UPI001253DAD0|nr:MULTISPECIES: glycoside hydrolase family 3 protein [unclassified Imperialibacter]CAD5270884.1 Beta-glucosidase / Beta-xylosidase [Imperialibacter sp. 89]CAD5298480.1 Beta-glucosidase / Beta-xylosidase [Imperialibacter sp. 75]VVT34930.1 Beta-glucosidase / Beta-xylosidase [Imperialibacter sp. EC-SDR9]
MHHTTPFKLASSLLLASLLSVCSCNSPTNKTVDYRDLNKNGKMDVYEDSSAPVEERVSDLLAQMTIEEKAGLMFINGTFVNADGTLEKQPGAEGFAARLPSSLQSINEMKMNHFNFWQIPDVQMLAKGYNAMQKVAEDSRLGIPVTIASDPRNHFSANIFAMAANSFSQWCETLGFAAIGDPQMVRQFAEIARGEYLAVGMKVSLHPQIDLATEPRWPRISGTFGEDAELTAKLVKAYIKGFQGDTLGPNSVATMTKHFPGGGPQKDGLDPHFEFQKGQVYPGNNFDYHLIPFEAAFEAGTASIMPYYGIPTDQTDENVAMAFNKMIITDLLRNKYKFDGVVCTDWGLITDANMGNTIWPARAWGVENLSEEDRVKKAIDAGVDQFGGESVPGLVVNLVEAGKVTEARIDESARRLLKQKFQLGLFDNPFVDEANVARVIGKPSSIAAGQASQRRAMTLLKNDGNVLPLQGKPKIFVKNIADSIAARYGTVVKSPKEADFAIIRINTPWVPVESENFMARGFHHGDLDFKNPEKKEILELLNTVPTIVNIYLDRPAVIPEISAGSKALIADFGATDEAVLDVIFGKASPGGKLPFELPSSMEAVRNQMEDVPYDSKDPLYTFGFGLSYE